MNQILDYDQNNRNSNRNPGGSSNVVRVFAIILIIFSIILISVVGYSKYSNQKDANTESEKATQAEISVTLNDDEKSAVITVTHDKNISKLYYSWNDNTERNISGSGKSLEESIDVPSGTNTLHIKVVDEIGTETTYDEEITSEKGIDIINPVIDLSITSDSKLKIVATDETGLDFITYRWNDDEEQQLFANEDSKRIETTIDILKGKNDLTVVAVDSSQNTTTDTKNFIGKTKPEITVTMSADKSKITIKATHEDGIKSVGFTFNGRDYNIDIGDGNPKEIQFDQALEMGTNQVKITVTSIDDVESVFDGKCTYGEADSIIANDESTTDTSSTENVENAVDTTNLETVDNTIN